MGKMSKRIVCKSNVRCLELLQDYNPLAGFGISGAETSGSTTNGILKHNYNTNEYYTYHEYVVPRSIPITVPTSLFFSSFAAKPNARRHITPNKTSNCMFVCLT